MDDLWLCLPDPSRRPLFGAALLSAVHVADGVELGGVETVEVVFGEASRTEEVGEDLGRTE